MPPPPPPPYVSRAFQQYQEHNEVGTMVYSKDFNTIKKTKKNPLYESMDSNTHGCNMLIFIVFSSSFGS